MPLPSSALAGDWSSEGMYLGFTTPTRVPADDSITLQRLFASGLFHQGPTPASLRLRANVAYRNLDPRANGCILARFNGAYSPLEKVRGCVRALHPPLSILL